METTQQMAVKYNITSKLKLPSATRKFLEEKGLSIVAFGTQLQVVHTGKNFVIDADVIKNAFIAGVVKNDPTAIHKVSAQVYETLTSGGFKNKFENFLDHFPELKGTYEGEPTIEAVVEEGLSTQESAVEAPNVVVPTNGFRLKMVTPEAVGMNLYSDTVTLDQAGSLYQPVKGTDGTSRYHVIGIGFAGEAKMVVAARINPGNISYRVESDLFEDGLLDGDKVKWSLKSVRKEKSNKYGSKWKYYVSGHPNFTIESEQEGFRIAARTIGGLLATLSYDFGVEWVTPLPNPQKLTGAGK